MENIIEKEIDGVLYKARFKGMAFANELNDKLENGESSFRLAEILFQEILVSPQMEIDDFADIETYTKVYDFLLDAANGLGSTKMPSKAKLKQRARDNWALWRLIFDSEGAIDYQAVFGKPFMTPQDVAEANFALDMVIEARRKAARKKK